MTKGCLSDETQPLLSAPRAIRFANPYILLVEAQVGLDRDKSADIYLDQWIKAGHCQPTSRHPFVALPG